MRTIKGKLTPNKSFVGAWVWKGRCPECGEKVSHGVMDVDELPVHREGHCKCGDGYMIDED